MSKQGEDSNMKMKEMEIDIEMLARDVEGLKRERLKDRRDRHDMLKRIEDLERGKNKIKDRSAEGKKSENALKEEAKKLKEKIKSLEKENTKLKKKV